VEKARILIVEDEHVIAKCMKLILCQEGFEVSDVVATGEEAVDVIHKIRPDLVLMDIKLRGKIDGITACQQIKDETDIPVVFVSAYTDTETIARANQKNPHGYITKPFKTERLIRTVKTALSMH
jgi:CheY-like chemotaxis protein